MPSHSLPVLPPDINPSHADQLKNLARSLDGEVRLEYHDRQLYATDASIYQVTPLAVVIPKHLDDLRETVRFCSERSLPMLPRGGGTSLAGQTVNRAVVIDCSVHCTRILDLDLENRLARVEPGVVLDQLNQSLAPHHLMFGPDVATATHATLGGMIGNNSSGAHSILYGRTMENLHGLKVLLADGEELDLHEGAAADNPRVLEITRRIAKVVLPLSRIIRDRYPKTLRRVNGYNLDILLDQFEQSTPGTPNSFDRVNLAHLFCGSEGSLGMTLEATLSLVELPTKKALAIIAFSSVDDALAALPEILALKPAAVELLDDLVMRAAKGNSQCRPLLDLLPSPQGEHPPAVLYVEFFARNKAELNAKLDVVNEQYGPERVVTYSDPPSMNQAWTLRKSGEPLLYGLPGKRKPVTFVEDLAVPPENLGPFVAEFREVLNRHGLTAAWYAHASVGCLHIRPLINLHDATDRALMETIIGEAADLVQHYGGALSGEHGDGRLRAHLLHRFYGPEICAAFRKIKEIFDPHYLMNPGAIVDPPPMLDSLRVKPEKKEISIPEVDTYFRYEKEGGFARAIEQCNGAGVCRKMRGGTMCPSYRATRDERHATRGRGNALRLAITGQSPPGYSSSDQDSPLWNDPETLKTLDLCLSCKACKTECPSSVNIAKLKAEYLAQSYRKRWLVPSRVRWLGNIRGINATNASNSLLRWGNNALNHQSWWRIFVELTSGIDRRRSLPQFQQPLYHWFTRRKSTAPQNRPAIILFPDCFTVYNEPHIGQAAVHLLESFGYRVLLPQTHCCGRSLISNSMLAQAQSVCASTAQDLLEIIKKDNPIAIVGCEPGCISAITDDWLDLKMNIEPSLIQTIASKTFLLEHFLETYWDEHPQHPAFSPLKNNKPILLHAHCHQNALWGTESSSLLLDRLLPGQITTLDSGCCGMAGAFGMTKDHYDLSMKIGELDLFPAIRAHPEAIVAATGTSCRHQIRDGLGVRALHPIEIIASMIHP